MDAEKIASNLRKLRLEKKATQAEVAKIVGVSISALTNYECGIRVPRDEIKIKLANYYGVTVESIFFSINDTN